MDQNTLYYGDNLDILRRYVKDETVDLVYLDPPFNSKGTYNVLFQEKDGSQSAAQITAFDDMWHWDQAAAADYRDVVESGGRAADALRAFRQLLGPNDMLAYLAMMAPRLIELRRVLKPTGSIYLHCDPTASHYLKVLMDAVFGPRNFRNEIAWCYGGGGSPRNDFPRKHDVILRYSVSGAYTFNKDAILIPYNEGTRLVRNYARKGTTKPWTANPVGKCPEDWWQLPIIHPLSEERLGYPTQKPEALLERIIKASSNAGDLVLDPFCGCGTAVVAAQRLGRRWIGVDITHIAVNLMRTRLRDTFGADLPFAVVGEPTTLQDAEELATAPDKYQFQWWALGLVGARPVEQRKGADRGIDGRRYFHDDETGETKQVIFSVKAGHTDASHVRDLVGVLGNERSEIGVLISFQEPTRPMREAAASAGYYESPLGTSHPRIQLVTVGELLAGRQLDLPRASLDVTLKRAPRAKGEQGKQGEMFTETG